MNMSTTKSNQNRGRYLEQYGLLEYIYAELIADMRTKYLFQLIIWF